MLVVPVIDLMDRQVVWGRAGDRRHYQPLAASCLTTRPNDPHAVAEAFGQLGLETLYVADLDAIAGARPAEEIYRQLAKCLGSGASIWVDAGLGDVETARQYDAISVPQLNWVIGLETLASPSELYDIIGVLGSQRLLVSLDLVDAAPLARWRPWQTQAALDVAEQLLGCGATRLIVLDLRRVGMGRGAGTEQLVAQIRSLDAQIQIVAGGGIQSEQDIRSLTAAGADGVLVASCLHQGHLDRASLKRLQARPRTRGS